MVAKCMKVPPALDDKLTNNALRVLKYAPLFLLAYRFWQMSNT
jgi:hypothetical protein